MINQASLYGIINNISTGNTIIDIILCLILPIIFTSLFDKCSNINKDCFYWVTNCLFNKYYERNLVYEKKSYWDNSVNGSRNNILQKAIELYISEHFSSKIFKHSDINFKAIQETSHYDSESGIHSYDKTVKQLKSYRVTYLPVKNCWISLSDKVDIKETLEEKKNEKGEVFKQVFGVHLRSKNNIDCDDFLKNVLKWYCDKLKEYDDIARYYYIPYIKKGSTNDLIYYRQKLTDFKQFDSIFFPNKTDFMSRIDSFLNKTGIYSISGYAYKLGILLHGPPGTGKTSLIKALAQYTNRHIINVSLATIKTRINLRRIFYELKFPLENDDMVKNTDYNNVIFILEDIDCMTKIACQRKTVDIEPTLLTNLKKDLALIDKNIKVEPELNLSDLLEIFDGIMDAPGRIIIMTTNHKDKLDKALIRPGRMDIDLLMDYIKYPDALRLIKHYNLENKKINKEKLEEYLNKYPETTPAKLIEMYNKYLY